MDDTIYRKDAIKKIAEHLGVPAENWMKIAEEWIKDVPSAQADLQPTCNQLATDCIGRQAVINEMKGMYAAAEKWAQDAKDDETRARAESCMATNVELKLRVEKLPSVQPEPLTDKEQRIFLAAMGREEKVCKQVDECLDDLTELYEDNLVRICHEITRKVKGALWT